MLYRTIFFFLLAGLCPSATAQQMPDAFLQNLTIMGKAFEENSETTLNENLRAELHKIVQWIEKHPKHISVPAIQAYKMQASILQTNKKLLESEPLLEKAYSMTLSLSAVDSIRLLRVDVLSFLEYSCARQNEFSGALHYNELAVQELKKVADAPNKIGFLFLTCFNRVALYNQMLKPQKMLESLHEIQPYLSYLPQFPPEFQAHYSTMKAAYDIRYMDSLRITKVPLTEQRADSFAQQAIQKLKRITPPSSEAQFFIVSYLQQAYTAYSLSERDTMAANLKILESLAGKNPEKTLFYRIFKSKHYEKWGMTKEFESEVNAAFKNKEKDKIEFPLVYLQLLQLKNQVLEQNIDTRPEVLAEHYQEVIDIYKDLRKNATNPDVLRVWSSYFTEVFKKATDVYRRLYENSKDLKDLNQMLDCAEQTKYFVLGREILQKQWTHKDFYLVQSRLNHFKKRKDKNAIDSVARYQKQWDSLEKQNHDLFIKTQTTTIEQIRSQLMSDKKVGFIEFTKVSNQRLNAIIVTHNTVFTWSSDSLIAIYEAAQIFKDSKWEGHATHKQIRNQLHHLYQLLFADILKSLPQINRLVLVGDEDLMLLPLGAFLVTPASSDLEVKDWNYMTKNYAITLLPSINVYTALTKAKQSRQSLQFHVYLAQFDVENNNNNNNNNKPLDALIAFSQNSKFKTYNITEPDNLCRALSNLKATDIPIFIAHGLIDAVSGQNQGLKLSNTQQLTLEMVRKQQFYFPLGILAANCNTALGNQEIGEGIHSHATAFLQAGVPSLLASTINVRDQYMAKILTYFVEYLEKGLPKDVALQKAQIQFVQTENLAPVFWSHVILLGDFSPL